MTMMFNSTSMKSYENIGGFQLGKWGYPQSSCSHGPWLSIETGPSSKLGISHDFLELSHNYSIIPSIISTRIYIIISTRTLTSLNILVVLSREWMGMGVAGIIINIYCGSFPPSLLTNGSMYGRLMLTKLGFLLMVNGKPWSWHTCGSYGYQPTRFFTKLTRRPRLYLCDFFPWQRVQGLQCFVQGRPRNKTLSLERLGERKGSFLGEVEMVSSTSYCIHIVLCTFMYAYIIDGTAYYSICYIWLCVGS